MGELGEAVRHVSGRHMDQHRSQSSTAMSPELRFRSELRLAETSPELNQLSEVCSVMEKRATVDDLSDHGRLSTTLAEPSSVAVLGDRAEAEAQFVGRQLSPRRSSRPHGYEMNKWTSVEAQLAEA